MRVLAPLALALLLAGCLDPGPASPRLACDPACNVLATVSPPSRHANELSIAVNPRDPLNVIATGKDYTPEEAGDCVWAGVYATRDGGRTWTNQNVPGSPWKRLRDPAQPETPFTRFWCATDPVVAFGPDGTAYWSVMPYQCDAASGSKTGRGAHPRGGLNDWFWTCSAMYVLVSTDGGLTWPVEKAREVAFGPRLEHDKQWLAVAPDGRVLLCWDRSPLDAPDPYPTPGAPRPDRSVRVGELRVVCSLSADKGDTWSEPAVVNPGWTAFYPWVDFDAEGTAYLAAVDGERVLVARSRDGLSWEAPVAVANYTNPEPGGEYGWPVLRGSDFRVSAMPVLAVDRSGGPYAGSVYVAWFDHSEGEGNVLLSWSRDGGLSWSAPARVHDDDPARRADQFLPALSVGPDGAVDVSWHDRRDDPGNHLFHLYYATSADGGRAFSPNLRVSETASDERHSRHQNGMVFLGDYRDSDSSAGRAVLAWTDTRAGKADVMVATVERPGAR